MIERTIRSKEPWWENPPKPGQTDNDLVWGWLIIYSNGEINFDLSNPPTAQEVEMRRGCRCESK